LGSDIEAQGVLPGAGIRLCGIAAARFCYPETKRTKGPILQGKIFQRRKK